VLVDVGAGGLRTALRMMASRIAEAVVVGVQAGISRCVDWDLELRCAHTFAILLCVMIALQPVGDVLSDALLEDEIRAAAADIHARMARLAERLVDFEERGLWRGSAMRDCAEWVSCNLGFDRHNARALMAAGHAARELTELGEGFSAGELSVDKLRLLAPVVTPDEQAGWVAMARESSPAELARRCREKRSAELTGPERDRAHRAQRRLHTWFDELNMFRISGALPPDEGAMVQLALDRARHRLRAVRSAHHVDIDLEPAEDAFHAEQADALVWICTEAVLGEPGEGSAATPSPVQMIVHVDYDVLTGANPEGRGHIEDGPALSGAVLRRLGCEATVKTLIERDGVAIAWGRERPTVSAAMRLAVRSRDGACRHPGCPEPASRCEAHHIHHVDDGGPTELWNLCALCKFHHQRHHDGLFDIHRTAEGDLDFVSSGGRLLGTATGGAWRQPRNRAGP